MKVYKSKTLLDTRQSAAGHVSPAKLKSKPGGAGAVSQACINCSVIDTSLRQTAQAKRLENMFSVPIQKQPVEDEKLLQGKFPVQRQDLKKEELLQEKSGNDSAPGSSVEPAGRQTTNIDTGIPPNVQAKMESALNTSLSSVRVHPNSGKAAEVGALAYTQGTDIHFGPGHYNPNTSSGQKLLGHELAHVVQQAEGRVQPTGEVAGLPLNDNPALEREADTIGAKAV